MLRRLWQCINSQFDILEAAFRYRQMSKEEIVTRFDYMKRNFYFVGGDLVVHDIIDLLEYGNFWLKLDRFIEQVDPEGIGAEPVWQDVDVWHFVTHANWALFNARGDGLITSWPPQPRHPNQD